jgi:hypothetical protein
MILSSATRRILDEKIASAPGTVDAYEIDRMRFTSHPILAILDGLVRMAEHHVHELETKICDDGYTGPIWLNMARDVRYMFSSASPKGFSGHACEAVFWHAMGVAGFTEGDL